MLAFSRSTESTTVQHFCSMTDNTSDTIIPYNQLEPADSGKTIEKDRKESSLVKLLETKLNSEEDDCTSILKLIETIIEDNTREPKGSKCSTHERIGRVTPFCMKVLLFLEEQTDMNIINTLGSYELPTFKKIENTLYGKKRNKGLGLTVLGKAYEAGEIGLTRNTRAAVYAYKHASLEKCPNGSFQYARCFEGGIGAETNLEKACQFYRISYKLGYSRGIYKYALMNLKGNEYIDKNIQYGLHLLTLSVSQTDGKYLEPYYALGMAYRSKNRDVVADHRYSFRIFLKGATLGCSNCQYQVSEDYERGECVGTDIDKAFMWCKEAAEQGHAHAQHKLSCVIMQIHAREASGEGDLLPKNIIASAEIDLRSINDVKNDRVDLMKRGIFDQDDFYYGEKFKNLNLGKFYGSGINVGDVAMKMAKEAASCGHVGAIILLAKILERKTSSDRDLLLSLWYYKIAESLGCKEASYKIASLEMSLFSVGGASKPSKKGFFSFLFWRN